jgi:DNA-binding transcriptional MerR regulator
MLIDTYKSLLKESLEDLINTQDDQNENFSVQDIKEILDELDTDELNEVGEFILELIYDPDFDNEDEDTLDEVKYFDTKKKKLDRNKKLNLTQRRKDAKKRKKYYKKNKSKLKRKNKLYRKKVKRQPSQVKKHRK